MVTADGKQERNNENTVCIEVNAHSGGQQRLKRLGKQNVNETEDKLGLFRIACV